IPQHPFTFSVQPFPHTRGSTPLAVNSKGGHLRVRKGYVPPDQEVHAVEHLLVKTQSIKFCSHSVSSCCCLLPDGRYPDVCVRVDAVPPRAVSGAAFRPPAICPLIMDFLEVRLSARARIEEGDRGVPVLANCE